MKLKKHLKVVTLSAVLTLLTLFTKAQVIPAVIPYDTPDYGTDNSTRTTNCDTKRACSSTLRVTVWDGTTPGLHWIFGGNFGTIPLAVSTAVKPDVAIISVCGRYYILVVYANASTTTYMYEVYQFTCSAASGNLINVPLTTGTIDPTITNDMGIHVDADQIGNFAIAYSIGTAVSNKIWTVIGSTNCNGLVFCSTPYMVNPSGIPARQTDPDVCVQQTQPAGSSDIKYTYLDVGHTLLCIQGGKHPGFNVGPDPCFEVPPANSAVYTYTAQTNHQLFSPRIAAPKSYFSSSLGDDYSVVFLERLITGGRFYIRGYTWTWPGPNPILLCPTSAPACIGVKTYNDGNGFTSPSQTLAVYDSEYPVITYADENPCQKIMVGWNARYPSPNSGNTINWDPLAVQLKIHGQAIFPNSFSPPLTYFQVPASNQSKDQKALSIAGRFSDDGLGSIQYSLYDKGPLPATIRGKFVQCQFNSLRPTGVNEVENIVLVMSLFPNPVENKLTVSFSGTEENSKLFIYNALGAKVKELQVPGSEDNIEIDTEGWTSGAYFIQLFSETYVIMGKGTFVKK